MSKGVKFRAQNILSYRASITQRADPGSAHDDPSADLKTTQLAGHILLLIMSLPQVSQS